MVSAPPSADALYKPCAQQTAARKHLRPGISAHLSNSLGLFWKFLDCSHLRHHETVSDMELIIKTLTGTHRLLVDPQDTVGSLKQRIFQTLKVPPHSQRLIFENGCRTPLNDDSKRLCDYGLQSGSQVALLIIEPAVIQVFLKNEKGVTTTYDIQPDETVTSLKAKVQHKEGVPANQQRLIHEGKEMMDGHKLADYDVRNMSTIYLTLRLRGG